MRKLIWLVLLAVPLVVLMTLPARVVLNWLDLPEELEQARGTIWQGQAHWRQPGHAPLSLHWQIDGFGQWRWQLGNGETDVRGLWLPAAGSTRLAEISGRVELDRVDIDQWLMFTRPRGFIELDIERAELRPQQPPEIVGRVIWREARLEGSVHEPLGEIAIDLQRSRVGAQSIRVDSQSPAPVQVHGTIELEAEAYEVDLWLRASADRPDLARELARMGEVQSDGQVRLQLRGALGW